MSEWLQQAVTHTVMFVYTEWRPLCKQSGYPNLCVSSLSSTNTHLSKHGTRAGV